MPCLALNEQTLRPFCFTVFKTLSFVSYIVHANVQCWVPDQTISSVTRTDNVPVRKTWLARTVTNAWMVISLWKPTTRTDAGNVSVMVILPTASPLAVTLASTSLRCSVLAQRNGVL